VRRPRPEQNRGYIAPGEERLARLRGDETPPDLKELYTIGPFDTPETPYFTGPAAYPSFAPNLWPARPVGLRPALQAYWHELDRVAQSLCRIFAEALDLEPEFFEDKVDRHISQLRIMHYPPPQVAPLPGQLRAGAHSDLGMMTLLYSDNDIGGLEVMDRAGRWVPVQVTDGAFHRESRRFDDALDQRPLALDLASGRQSAGGDERSQPASVDRNVLYPKLRCRCCPDCGARDGIEISSNYGR